MDKRSKVNLLLFLRRFRMNYHYFLKTYSGQNASLYLDQFVQDNLRLAQVLFGNEGVKQLKENVKKLSLTH